MTSCCLFRIRGGGWLGVAVREFWKCGGLFLLYDWGDGSLKRGVKERRRSWRFRNGSATRKSRKILERYGLPFLDSSFFESSIVFYNS